jgi:hypothetical protein
MCFLLKCLPVMGTLSHRVPEILSLSPNSGCGCADCGPGLSQVLLACGGARRGADTCAQQLQPPWWPLLWLVCLIEE